LNTHPNLEVVKGSRNGGADGLNHDYEDDLVYILNNLKINNRHPRQSLHGGHSTSSLNGNSTARPRSSSSTCSGNKEIKCLSARSYTDLTKKNSHDYMSRFTIGENGILSSLLHEFPYLYTSPETIHYLWQKHATQIQTLTKSQKEISHLVTHGQTTETQNTTKVQAYLRETHRKQEMLMEIMRKELQHMQRMQDLKRKQQIDNQMKAKQREQRCQSAKVKRYYEEFRLKQRSRLIKQTHSEEVIFKRMFNESLKLQKERMLEMKRYAKEKNELNSIQQMNKIESIENFYKNKFTLLNEKMQKEKEEVGLREKAQHVALSTMKVQVRSKLEKDIIDLHEQMCRDKDFLYWRQMDANRVKSDVNKASYFKQKKQ
jgi:centrosomal protein CEP95